MRKRIFKRKVYDKMLEWKRERNGSTALLLKGARRVGKSTVAKDFKKDGQTLLVPIYMTPLL